MKFAFASDLHITKNEDWTLDVLDEILAKCKNNGIHFLFFGGDVFDSFDDLSGLKDRFNEVIGRSNLEKVFFLPGNHDLKGITLEEFSGLQFDEKIKLISTSPLDYRNVGGIEFVFIPFQKDFLKIYNTSLPEKRSKRIVIGHGSLIDYNFAGEDEDCYFDEGLFEYLEADLVLLGHIHKNVAKGKIIYPGSARVWRNGEVGKHGFYAFDLEENKANFIELESGGKIVEVNVMVENENFEVKDMPSELPKNCWLVFKLKGFVQDERMLENIRDSLSSNGRGALKIFFDEENVLETGSCYDSELFKIFMEKWREHYDTLVDNDEKMIYELARKYFLYELSSLLEGKN
jgi:DNA repair exonuclease SbcCD nuclease subunit